MQQLQMLEDGGRGGERQDWNLEGGLEYERETPDPFQNPFTHSSIHPFNKQ